MSSVLVTKLISAGLSPVSGRYYPKDELEKMVERAQGELLRLFGVMNIDKTPDEYTSIENIATKVNDIYMEGNDVVAAMEILGSKSGLYLQELVDDESVLLQISPSMMGKIKEDGDVDVAYDLKVQHILIKPLINTEEQSSED